MFKPANGVQIRISINEIEANVWGRLVLPVHLNLEHLHLGIQAALNWWNYHLYEFRIGGLRYGDVEILTEERRRSSCLWSRRGSLAGLRATVISDNRDHLPYGA
jgi:hypothetical protein